MCLYRLRQQNNYKSIWKEHIGADVISIMANEPLGMTEFLFDGIKIGLMCLLDNDGKGHYAEVELKENVNEV